MAENDNGTVSIEEYNRLKDTQSGVDRNNTRLQAENKELLEKQAALQESINKANNSNNEDYLKRTEILNRKQKVIEIAMDKGIDPAEAMALLGLNDNMDDVDRLDMLGEMKKDIELKAADSFAKSHGTTPHFSLPKTILNYEQILAMPDNQIAKLPDSVIERAQDAVRPKKLTLRDKLRGVK